MTHIPEKASGYWKQATMAISLAAFYSSSSYPIGGSIVLDKRFFPVATSSIAGGLILLKTCLATFSNDITMFDAISEKSTFSLYAAAAYTGKVCLW